MYQKISFKRGDTFVYDCAVTTVEGPTDITDWVITSWVRVGAKIVEKLTVTVLAPALGTFNITSATTTPTWPLGELSFDIKYQLETGQVIHTESVAIDCKRSDTE